MPDPFIGPCIDRCIKVCEVVWCHPPAKKGNMFGLIRHTRIALEKAPLWGLWCLNILTHVFPEKSYAVLWRETAQIAISRSSSLKWDLRQKVRATLAKRKVNTYLIDGSRPYRYCEPFCRFLARHANEEELDWALHQGVQFGVRTPNGATFLSDAVTHDNTEALTWAKKHKFNFNVLSQYQAPLLAFLMTTKTPFHPYVALFMEAGASLDFKGGLGITARQVLEQNPSWLAQWEKKMLKEHLSLKTSILPRQTRKM